MAIDQTSASPTATPTLSPAPSLTPTSTLTPTPTPTPTATAPPLSVAGDPRTGRLSPPASQGNAPCGVVDLLDFPLDPPDGQNVAGGGDFGRFRDRFGKYHAGEDWWGPNRRSSFGQPVYSIGHGLVTYAEPEGWNRDKGVLIIKHTLADGSTVLSFYGHLDPASVVLKPGQCVARGQQIGEIGRPRSSPHLHFEIRSQSPYAPLTGYWPEDPTLVGWFPPSHFIWNQRIASAPGVLWTRPFVAEGTQAIGMADQDTFVAIEDSQLIGINREDGRVRWRYGDESAIKSAVLDARNPVIYVAGVSEQIQALRLPAGTDAAAAAPVPLWQITLAVAGAPALIPLAEGGVLVSVAGTLFGVGPEGTLSWQRQSQGQLVAWTLAGNDLWLSTTSQDSPLWQIDGSGPQLWQAPASGRPLIAAGQVWLYDGDGLYRLSDEGRPAELQYSLARGSRWLGDVAALSDGGVLLAHADAFDRRLIAFNADGSLRWQRSYGGAIGGKVRLLVLDDEVYLVAEDNSGSSSHVSVFAVDVAGAGVTRIFMGGTRSPISADTWVLAAGEQLLLNIGGGNMVALGAR